MADQRYWQWDACRWGTHRVNYLQGSRPFRVHTRDGKVILWNSVGSSYRREEKITSRRSIDKYAGLSSVPRWLG